MNGIMLLCALLMLIFGVYAVMEHSILRSAIGLALSSAALAMMFYAMGAPLASVFELSVCSGLVTVIFISGISLSHSPKMEVKREFRDAERNRFLPLLLIALGAGLVAVSLSLGYPEVGFATGSATGFREVFWNSRQADVWGQIAAILCGGVAVAVLFREERRDHE